MCRLAKTAVTNTGPVICSDILQALSLQRHWKQHKSVDHAATGTLLRFQCCFQSHVASGDWLGFQPHLPMLATCWHLPTSRACRGRATPAVSMLRMRLLWQGPIPPFACMLEMEFQWQTRALSCAHPQLQLRPHSSPFKLSLHRQFQSSPQVCLLKPKFSTQSPHKPADVHLRLESTGRWPGPFVLVFLCSACHNPTAVLLSSL